MKSNLRKSRRIKHCMPSKHCEAYIATENSKTLSIGTLTHKCLAPASIKLTIGGCTYYRCHSCHKKLENYYKEINFHDFEVCLLNEK